MSGWQHHQFSMAWLDVHLHSYHVEVTYSRIINMYDRICIKLALKQFPSAKGDSSESSYSTKHGSC